MYGNETVVWRLKENSRVRDIQMDNLRDLLGVRRINRVLNAWVRRVMWKDEEDR